MEESKQIEERSDLLMCYHEAGHAVFAVKVCGGSVRYVDADEMICLSRGPVETGWDSHWRAAMRCLAGDFARDLVSWDEIDALCWQDLETEAAWDEGEGLESDETQIVEHVYEMGGDPDEEYRSVVEGTEEIARELWPQITAVAEALRERRRLDGKEVAAIIDGLARDAACPEGSA